MEAMMEGSYSEIERVSESLQIDDLPDEILEFIISLLKPYNDLKSCMLVSKRWNANATRVLHYKLINFNKCLTTMDLKWEHYLPMVKDSGHSISKRYSHSACSKDNWMYVFGGCTCTNTTFNDLWQLNLSSRKWERLLTMGTYPTPKALATFVHYEGQLVLFGGWTHPTPFPLHQAWRTFNELHMYDIETNRWTCVVTPELSPPPMAGHSATVHGKEMVVFGGIVGQSVSGSANLVWCFDFVTQSWRQQYTTEPKPCPRYNQSQIAIDENHLLIIGGCGKPSLLLNDIWLLTMNGVIWDWTQLTVHNAHLRPPNAQLWCHPACKVGSNVIMLGRSPAQSSAGFSGPKLTMQSRPPQLDHSLPRRASDNVAPPVDRDVNVNGRRGSLTNPRNQQPGPSAGLDVKKLKGPIHCNLNLPSGSNMAAFRAVPSGTGKHRDRQLEVLARMEERLRLQSLPPPPPRPSSARMAIFVLDISQVLENHSVTWLPQQSVPPGGPDHTILYSLVPGQAEVIMFGGIQKDFNSQDVDMGKCPTNSLHFITAPKSVV